MTPIRGYATTPGGQIHFAEAGAGPPVLFLHQTPRSWLEFGEVLPLVGMRYRAIAMDTIGFGESYKPAGALTIEDYARGVLALLDALELPRVSLVGHHTGGVVAVEVAATHPERTHRLVLSSTPYVDARSRERRRTAPPIDAVDEQPDGSHLVQMWRNRMDFYPSGRPDLLHRLVLDALKTNGRMEEGHRAVGAYRMEDQLPRIQAPTLVLAGSADPFALPQQGPLAEHIAGSTTAVIEGGMVPMPEQMPDAFAEAVLDFLDRP